MICGTKYLLNPELRAKKIAKLIMNADIEFCKEFWRLIHTPVANKVVKAFINDELKEATRLQLQFASYPNRWMGHGLTPTMKASFKLLGMSAGDPYPPHPPISGDDLKALDNYLKTTDFFVK